MRNLTMDSDDKVAHNTDDSWDDTDDDLIESAWGIIANVRWEDQNANWREAAIRWRDRYHKRLALVTEGMSSDVEEPYE